MRIEAKLVWPLLVITLAACSVRSESAPMTLFPNSPTSSAIVPNPTQATMPTSSMTPTSPPSVIVVTQPVLEDINWATYVFDAGVSFEYPADCIIVSSQEDSVEFFGLPYLPYNVRVNVYARSVEDKAITDPHSWVPNEGNYEVLWEKPIAIENATGLEFIWGVPADHQIGGVLTAIYYSEQHELDVRLATDADSIPTDSDKYDVFEYMVQSVRIAP